QAAGKSGGAGAAAGLRAGKAALRASETAIRAQADERIAELRESADGDGPPSASRPARIAFNDGDWDADDNPIQVDWLPGFANDWLNRQVARTEKNVQRLQEDPDLFKDSLLGAIPSTLFVLLPLFAL